MLVGLDAPAPVDDLLAEFFTHLVNRAFGSRAAVCFRIKQVSRLHAAGG